MPVEVDLDNGKHTDLRDGQLRLVLVERLIARLAMGGAQLVVPGRLLVARTRRFRHGHGDSHTPRWSAAVQVAGDERQSSLGKQDRRETQNSREAARSPPAHEPDAGSIHRCHTIAAGPGAGLIHVKRATVALTFRLAEKTTLPGPSPQPMTK